jgi:hypothetical protein
MATHGRWINFFLGLGAGVDQGKLECSFCGLPQSKLNKLVGGRAVYVCDRCIVLGHEVLSSRTAKANEYIRLELLDGTTELACSFCGGVSENQMFGGRDRQMCSKCLDSAIEIIRTAS